MARAKDTLKGLGVQPSKQRGQNFVIDGDIILQFLDFARLESDERVVEIGPGLGALTTALQERSALTVIEIEPSFCSELRRQFPHITVIEGDAREVDFSAYDGATVVGNLPYAFSTDIVSAVVRAAPVLRRAIFMLQREFAERMAAEPGCREYGTLSVYCSLWSAMTLGPVIPGTAFHPPASVASRLIELKFLKKARVAIDDGDWFRRVVKACFHSRRRTLQNSLIASGIVPREAVAAVLTAAGIDPMRRAETLALEEFAALADRLQLIIRAKHTGRQ